MPPIKLTPGKSLLVIRDPVYMANLLQQRIYSQANGKYIPANPAIGNASSLNVVNGNQQLQGLQKLINLQIPDDAPIALSAALQIIEKQVGIVFLLDARVSPDIKFIASVSQMPLGLFLDRVAPANGYGSLKWYVSGNRIIIAPSDRLELRSGPNVIGSTFICTQCHSPLGRDWSYCPQCGLITPRGQMAPKKNPQSLPPHKE